MDVKTTAPKRSMPALSRGGRRAARGSIVLLMLACAAVSAFAQSPAQRITDARIVSQPPAGLEPARHLTPQDRRDNLEALWKAIDITYAHFELKSIDWNEVGRRYQARLDTLSSDDGFYRLLSSMIAELKDTHSWLQNYRESPLPQVTSIALDSFDGTPFVVAVRAGSEAERAGVKPGWQVVSVDGLTSAEKIEALRPLLHGFSSERAFRREATRRLLSAEKPTPATIVVRQLDGGMQTVTLARESGPTVRRPSVTPGFGVTQTTDVEFGVHPSGVGYIRIQSFGRRDDLDREFDTALDAVRNAPSLILDIRDNPGGFSHPWIVGRFLENRTQTVVSIIKSGAGHGAFRTQPGFDRPTGPWQYAGRVVLLVNDLTGSAADLFPTELRSSARVTVVGSTTHGNLSGTAAFAVLPCNVVVRISNGYIADTRGRPVEVNGNVPDVIIEPTIEDLLAGRDRVLERAVALLTGKPPVKGSRR
jgi:C-terminal processing protease CtpA/Prc